MNGTVREQRADVRLVTITDIDLQANTFPMAYGYDRFQGGQFSIDLSHGIGDRILIPRVGEEWVIRRPGGTWILDHKLDSQMARDGGTNNTIATYSVDPRFATHSTFPQANLTVYCRMQGSGSFASVGLDIEVSSGNIAVALYNSISYGGDPVPHIRMATTGELPCPPVGTAQIWLDHEYWPQPGDWFAVSADNSTVDLAGQTATRLGLLPGFLATEAVFPPPETANPAPVAAYGFSPVVIGYSFAGSFIEGSESS